VTAILYSAVLHSILFYSILFYSILLCSIMFSSVLFCDACCNIGFFLLPHQAQQLHHVKGLHLLGHPMTSMVLKAVIKKPTVEGP
jgi:hypothetical protein